MESENELGRNEWVEYTFNESDGIIDTRWITAIEPRELYRKAFDIIAKNVMGRSSSFTSKEAKALLGTMFLAADEMGVRGNSMHTASIPAMQGFEGQTLVTFKMTPELESSMSAINAFLYTGGSAFNLSDEPSVESDFDVDPLTLSIEWCKDMSPFLVSIVKDWGEPGNGFQVHRND